MTCTCGQCSGSVIATGGCNNESCCTTPTTTCCSTANTTGVPYYSCVSTCPEDNSCTTTITKTAGVFKTCRSFVMPNCGVTVSVTFESITSLPIGAWMWSGDSGTFEIMGYDSETGIVQLKNLCPDAPLENAASPGAVIPGCTVFVLSMPDATTVGGVDTPYPYLSLNFIAPANGNCVQIQVTNVNGLAVGSNLAIGGGTYSLQSVDSPTLITICNDGAGATAGSVIVAEDAFGNLIVPIVSIDVNPCTATPVTEAAVLGCNAGVTQPLTGLVAGQVLVLNDPVTGDAEYQSLGVPVACCAVLTVCLTLDHTFPAGTSYSITVDDTSCFEEGDLITIGDPATILYVDSIDGPTTMHATPQPDPVALVTYPEASVICLSDCCSILDYKLAEIFAVVNYANETGMAAPVTLDAVTVTSVTSSIGELFLENKSTHNPMGVQFNITGSWVYSLTGTAGQVVEVHHKLNVYWGTDPVGVPLQRLAYPTTYALVVAGGAGATTNAQSFAATYSAATAVNPLEIAHMRVEMITEYNNGDATGVEVTAMDIVISANGMAPYLAP